MKTLSALILFVLLNLGSVYSSNSQNKPEKPVIQISEKHYELLLSRASNNEVIFRLVKEKNDVFKLRILDSEGKKIHYYKVKRRNKIKTTFDISEFPAGEHTFQILRNRKEIHSMKIEKE